MQFGVTKVLCAIGAIAQCSCFFLSAGEVRICFFQDTNSIRQTVEFLTRQGCSQRGISVFEQAIHGYLKESFHLDLSKFPMATNGFYRFASPQDLITVFPNQFPELTPSFYFNCAEVVIALADGGLRTTSRPNDLVGPIFVRTGWVTNHEESQFAATWQDAYDLTVTSPFRERTDSLLPQSMHSARVCLEPFVLQWYLLPQSTGESNVETKVLDVLRATWKREGIEFPSRYEVVLIHNVDLSKHFICTRHAGLLFQRENGCTFIEKAGNRGPFIRLDLASRSDLLPWFNLPLGNCAATNCHHFATFNDRTIERISRR